MSQMARRSAESRTPRQVTQTGVSFSLRGVAVQVRNQADAEGVGVVQPLDDAEVAGRLRQTLAETQPTVIHGQSMSIKVTCRRERKLLRDFIR